MVFTALHRAYGLAPCPMTGELLDQAVGADVVETSDLDSQPALPPARAIPRADFLKDVAAMDVAAMANGGGGVIILGVRETNKAATQRTDVEELTDSDERALLGAAITAISPIVFDLELGRLGAEGERAVVVSIPASVDGPHLVYRNDYLGAPVRNEAHTVWMKERQMEATYRTHFDERRPAMKHWMHSSPKRPPP